MGSAYASQAPQRFSSRTVRTLILLMAGLATAVALEAQRIAIPDSLPPGVTVEMVHRGRIVFEGLGLCASCHGRHAGNLLGPNLTNSEWWHVKGTYLGIVERILSGVPKSQALSGNVMLPRGGAPISDREVRSVAAYIWNSSHPEVGDSLPAGVSRGMIEQGREVFLGAGGCTECHGADATQETAGPDLDDDEWLHSKGSFLSIMWQVLVGVPAEDSRNGVAMAPRGGTILTNADVHAVAAYVWVLSHPSHR